MELRTGFHQHYLQTLQGGEGKDQDQSMQKLEEPAPNSSMADENGNCKRCGHPFDPHIVIAYDTKDFSKGGEMRCPVKDCSCFHTVSFG